MVEQKKTLLEELTDDELNSALEEAGQKEISPEIKEKVNKFMRQKKVGAHEAITFVYYGGPRVE